MSGSQEIAIYVPYLFGVDPNAVTDISIISKQSGTEVTLSYVGMASPFIPMPKSYSDFLGFPCFILDVSTSIGSEIVTIDGYIGPGNIRNSVSTVFLNSELYKIDGLVPSDYFYINDRTALEKDPNIEFVSDLTVVKLMTLLAQRNNINVQIDGIIDYKIFSYESRKGASLFEVFEQLALEGGSNAVVLFDQIRIIPWGTSSSTSALSIDKDRVTQDFNYSVTLPEFNAVQIECSPVITPWNSFYVGNPEKLASLNFEAGPISTKDISLGTGVIQPSKEWVFPEVPGNDWVDSAIEFREEENQKGETIVNKLSSVDGLQAVWDYTFGFKDEYEYNLAFRDAQAHANLSLSNTDSGQDYVRQYMDKYKYSTQKYRLLRRWASVTTRVQGQGDVHPFIYVVPGDSAPESSENMELFKVQDTQELNIHTGEVVPSSAFETVNMPESLRGITPRGYGKRLARFAGDGSFELSAFFGPARSKRKYMATPNISVVVYPDALYYTNFFGTITVIKNRSYATVSYPGWADATPPADTLAKHLDDVCRKRILSEAVVFSREGASVISPNGGPIFDIRNGFNLENAEDQNAFNAENVYLTNSMKIKSIAPAQLDDGTDDPNTAIIWFTQACRLDYSGVWSMAKARVNHVTSQVAKMSSEGKYESFTDSGLVEQNQQSIKSSWSIYGVKRKTFPAVGIASNSSKKIAYRGVTKKLDQEIVELLKRAGTNIKVVTPEIMTDTMSSNSHLRQLLDALFAQLSASFFRFNCSYVGFSLLDVPQVGSYAGVNGIFSQVTETSITISEGDLSHSFTVGKLPIL